MGETLLLVGIACVIAAIVGGGLKILHIELPAIASVDRQVLLGLAGTGLMVASFALPESGPPAQPPPTIPMSPIADQEDQPSPPVLPEPPDFTLSTRPEPPDIVLSRTSGPAGSSVAVSGAGFAPGETVIVRFHTRELARVETDQQGAFSSTSVQVPPDWRFTGQHDFVVRGLSSVWWATAPFEVTER